MNIVISYDITDDRVRNKLSSMLEEFGIRVQYSLFELEISKKDLQKLSNEISRLIDKKNDSVRIYHLCQNCQQKSYEIAKRAHPFNFGISFT